MQKKTSKVDHKRLLSSTLTMTHLFPKDLAGLQATWRWKTRDAGQGAGSAIHNKSTNVLGGYFWRETGCVAWLLVLAIHIYSSSCKKCFLHVRSHVICCVVLYNNALLLRYLLSASISSCKLQATSDFRALECTSVQLRWNLAIHLALVA